MAEEQRTQNGRVEVTEQERAARIAERTEHYRRELAQDGYVQTTPGHWERQGEITTASPERAAAFVNGAAERAVADRAAEQQWREQQWREQQRPAFEQAAAQGGWAPSWTGKPAVQLSDNEIIAEARSTHQQYRNLSQEYAGASESRRAELRQEVQPLADRARELRVELSGRNQVEISRETAPASQIGFSQ